MSSQSHQIWRSPYIYILGIGIIYFIISEISHYSMHTTPPHLTILNGIHTNYCLTNSCLGGALTALCLAKFKRTELGIIAFFSILAEIFFWNSHSADDTVLAKFMLCGTGAFIVCTVAILAQLISDALSGEKERLYDHINIFAMMTTMAILYGIYLPENPTDLRIYDPMLYAADSLTGTQPSFHVAAFLYARPLLTKLMFIVYIYLPTWLLLAQIMVYKAESQGRLSTPFIPAISYIVAVFLGLLGYGYIPAIGTEGFCGSGIFPNGPIPPVTEVPRAVLAPASIVRNAMPSLHLGLILCSFMAVCNLGKKQAVSFFALVVLTIISAIQIGQHWITDFLVTFPFIAGVLGLVSYRAPLRMRLILTLGGGSLNFLMMFTLKEHIDLCLAHPALYWLAIIIIDSASIAGLWWLSKFPQSAQEPEKSSTPAPIGQ